jgi:hypothetical protein
MREDKIERHQVWRMRGHHGAEEEWIGHHRTEEKKWIGNMEGKKILKEPTKDFCFRLTD